MRTTEFERRQPAFIRGVLIAAAVSTYLFERDDVVWRFVRNSPANRELEHIAFLMAAVAVGAGAALCTWAEAYRDVEATGEVHSRRLGAVRYAGEWIYAAGLASLLPLSGAVLLVFGELLRVSRLMRSEKAIRPSPAKPADPLQVERPVWGRALRKQAGKWGILVTMLALAVTLVDRLADVLALGSVLLWVLLNARTFRKSKWA